jgi:hypothetical protein
MYGTIDSNKLDEAIEKLKKIVPDESGKYPEKLSESYSLGGNLEFFRLVEATEEQLMNLMVNTLPEISFRYVPIFKLPEIFKKHFDKT